MASELSDSKVGPSSSDLIGNIAISQLEYPEGIGVENSLIIQRIVIGNKTLIDATVQELEKILILSRKKYKAISIYERQSS